MSQTAVLFQLGATILAFWGLWYFGFKPQIEARLKLRLRELRSNLEERVDSGEIDSSTEAYELVRKITEGLVKNYRKLSAFSICLSWLLSPESRETRQKRTEYIKNILQGEYGEALGAYTRRLLKHASFYVVGRSPSLWLPTASVALYAIFYTAGKGIKAVYKQFETILVDKAGEYLGPQEEFSDDRRRFRGRTATM